MVLAMGQPNLPLENLFEVDDTFWMWAVAKLLYINTFKFSFFLLLHSFQKLRTQAQFKSEEIIKPT